VIQVIRQCETNLNWGMALGAGPEQLQIWVLNSHGGSSLAWLDRLHGIDILGREPLGGVHSLGGRGGVELSPSGAYMGVSLGNPTGSEFRLYDPYTRLRIDTIAFPGSWAGHFAYAGSDDEVWVTCDPNSIDTNAYVLDVPGRALAATVPLGPDNYPNDIVYHPLRDSFFVSVGASGIGPSSLCPDPADILEVDRTSRAVVNTLFINLSTPCGGTLYADENCDGIALDPTGTLLAVTLANFSRVVFLDTATGAMVGSPVPSGNSPREIVWDGATGRFSCFNLCDDEACTAAFATVAAIDVSGVPTKVGAVDLSPSHTPVALGTGR
jgi:DNA-binding beta-propeller fold protein YncE